MFPDSISLSTSLISELRDILLFSIGGDLYTTIASILKILNYELSRCRL